MTLLFACNNLLFKVKLVFRHVYQQEFNPCVAPYSLLVCCELGAVEVEYS